MKARNLIVIIVVIAVVVGVLIFTLRGSFFPPAFYPEPVQSLEDWRTAPGTVRQPPNGLVKNETVFAQYFSDMSLVTDGWTSFDDATNSFSSSQNVILLANCTNTANVLVYVDDAGNRGSYAGIESERNTTIGLNTIYLGKLQPGSYIARVLANEICVGNLVFEVT